MNAILFDNKNIYSFEKIDKYILNNISIKNLTERVIDRFSLISVKYNKADFNKIKNSLENKKIESEIFKMESLIRSYSTESLIKNEKK